MRYFNIGEGFCLLVFHQVATKKETSNYKSNFKAN